MGSALVLVGVAEAAFCASNACPFAQLIGNAPPGAASNAAAVEHHPDGDRVRVRSSEDYRSLIHSEDGKWSAYKGVRKVLFLSDLEDAFVKWESTGKKVATAHPDIEVIRGDMRQFKSEAAIKNLRDLQIDNSDNFPDAIAENSQDLIVMRRGLCLCGPKKVTCGGIPVDSKEASQFFLRIAKALNKKNPKAGAYLLNDRAGHEQSVTFWKQVAARAMAENPNVRIEVLVTEKGQNREFFDGIRIVPK